MLEILRKYTDHISRDGGGATVRYRTWSFITHDPPTSTRMSTSTSGNMVDFSFIVSLYVSDLLNVTKYSSTRLLVRVVQYNHPFPLLHLWISLTGCL